MTEKPKGAPIDKVLSVMRALDGKVLVTSEIFNELVAIAARLEEIEQKAQRGDE